MSRDGPFAVPLPAYQLGIHTARKRKRAATAVSAASADVTPAPVGTSSRSRSRAPSPTGSQYSSNRAGSSRPLPADSINPLSHSPDTLHQFVVAGLNPEDENPATLYPGFPHKPLPKNAHYFLEANITSAAHVLDNRSFYDGSDADELDDVGDAGTNSGATDSKIADRGQTIVQKQTARLKHIAVMTALVHRCIAKGDIARAKRAFGLLAQTKGVDIKLNNFWLIGSEILMRQGEAPPANSVDEPVASSETDDRRRRSSNPSASPEAGNGTRIEYDENAVSDGNSYPGIEQDQQPLRGSSRWGRAENVETVRNYFEHLIAHYPYDKHRPHLVSAADFYPALYNFEIYHVSAEFAAAIERLEEEYSAGRDSDEQDSNNSYLSDDDPEDREYQRGIRAESQDIDELGEGQDFRQKINDDMRSSNARRTYRQEATDEIRRQTQLLAQQIANNMDRTMENPPFSSHPELLRLRANLAIFIADLYLPIRILEKVLHALDIPRPGMQRSIESSGSTVGHTQRRKRAAAIMDSLAKYVHGPEEQVAVLDMRPQEQRRARDLFRKVMAQGVVVEAWVERFVEMVDRWDEAENEAASHY